MEEDDFEKEMSAADNRKVVVEDLIFIDDLEIIIYSTVAPKANFKLIMIVPMYDNQGNLINIEDMVVGVFNKLAASTTLKISH